MANKFCKPCGMPPTILPHREACRLLLEVHRTIVGWSQGCGVQFGVACWHAFMSISEKKQQILPDNP
jgi:hypothetical protein